MAQTSASSDIIAELRANVAENSIVYAMGALIAYEYLITVQQEVTMVWQRRWSLVTVLFWANRYSMIVIVIQGMSPVTTKSSCGGVAVLSDTFISVQYTIFAVFSSLRVFAIWGRHIPIAALVLLLNLVPVATNIYLYTRETIVFLVVPLLGPICTFTVNISDTFILHLALATRLPVICADVLVLAITWHKTFRTREHAARAGMRTPLATLLLRDGTIYFMALLILNIAQVLVDAEPSLENIAPVGTIITALQPILISRFLLNLRQVGSESENDVQLAGTSHSQFSAPRFNSRALESIVGNMGEELDHNPPTDVMGDVYRDSEGACILEQAEVET